MDDQSRLALLKLAAAKVQQHHMTPSQSDVIPEAPDDKHFSNRNYANGGPVGMGDVKQADAQNYQTPGIQQDYGNNGGLLSGNQTAKMSSDMDRAAFLNAVKNGFNGSPSDMGLHNAGQQDPAMIARLNSVSAIPGAGMTEGIGAAGKAADELGELAEAADTTSDAHDANSTITQKLRDLINARKAGQQKPAYSIPQEQAEANYNRPTVSLEDANAPIPEPSTNSGDRNILPGKAHGGVIQRFYDGTDQGSVQSNPPDAFKRLQASYNKFMSGPKPTPPPEETSDERNERIRQENAERASGKRSSID